jgi:multidrug efflux system outer membrane protein
MGLSVNFAMNIFKMKSLDLSESNIKTLRYAVGAAVSMAFAMGINWPYAYLTMLLTVSLLSSPAGRLSFKQGVGFLLVIMLACLLAVKVGEILIPYPMVFIPFLGVLLFRIYYEKGARLSSFIILWLLIALLVIPLIMLYNRSLSSLVVMTLIVGGAFAIISSWIAYAIFPEKPKLGKSALTAAPLSNDVRYRQALESTAAVFPLLIIFYMFRLSGALLVLIYVALLSMQPQFAKDFKQGKALIIANVIGGAAAVVAYNLLTIVPEYYFLLLLTLLTGLIFGARLFSGNPKGAIFGTSFSTFLLIIGSVTGAGGDGEAAAEIYTRILQIMSALVYLVLFFGALDYLKSHRRKKKMLKKIRKGIIPVGAALFLVSGCTMGPNYTRPENISGTADKTVYHQQVEEGESIANMPWWEMFGDTVLQGLIRESIANNLNLRSALARIQEARIGLTIVRSNLYPKIDYGGNGGYDNLFGDKSSSSVSSAAALDVSYQVDLWGRVKRSNEASLEQLLATEEAYRNITITLVSEVASAYLLLRDIDNRLYISESTAETRRKSLDVVKAKYEAGIVAEVDVNQSEIQLADAEASVKTFDRLRGQTENVINLLLSRPPRHIRRGMSLQEQVFPPKVPVGLPSDLLERRPDLLQAEHSLHAQTARIGVAEALRYPQLNLTADLGGQFSSVTSFFANLGAQLFGPLYNAGAIQGKVDIEVARTKQLLAQYEQTFYTALREVEDALIAVRTYSEEKNVRIGQMKSAKNAVELSWIRYESGMTSYLEVLDVQRSLFAAQLKASESLQMEYSSMITLYKALGGGWNPKHDAELGLKSRVINN